MDRQTLSSFDQPKTRGAQPELQAGALNFQNVDLAQLLAIYQEISGRTVIRPSALPSPTISVRNQTPLTRIEALQLLDTALAENGITMVLMGDSAVKAVPAALASSESPPEITLPWEALPDSSSMMMRTVQLKHVRPSEVVPILVPFSKLSNAILPVDSRKQLILRDYSSNIRRMLRVLQDVDKESAR